MTISLEKLADGLFLYVWKEEISIGDIRASMVPEFESARQVIFDLSEVNRHPLHLAAQGAQRHRILSNLRHVYLVYRPEARASAELLVGSTLRAPYSMYLTREAALEQALADVPAFTS